MNLHGGPNLARGPEFDTHDLKLPNTLHGLSCLMCSIRENSKQFSRLVIDRSDI